MLYLIPLFAMACASPEEPAVTLATQPEQTAKLSAINIEEFKHRWDQGELILIDVRTPNEFHDGHVPGARPIPLNKLTAEIPSLLQYKEQEMYLICAVGGRSGKAQQILQKEGFTKTINVDGGTNGWSSKGYPLEK